MRRKWILVIFCGLLSGTVSGQWTWRNPLPQGNDLHIIKIMNDNSVWAAGSVGTVMHSEDGGLNWEIKNLVGNTKYVDIIGLDFPTDTIGFAVDYHGYIFKTTDAGITWDSVYHEPEEYLNASFFADTQHGFVVCDEGKIISTSDGGTTWTPYYFSEPVTLNSVWFTSYLTGYAAGRSGYILKTTDGGNSWNAIHIGSNDILSIIFPTNDKGFAVGDSGQVMKTTDGGLTWSNQYLNDSSRFSSVAAFSPDTLILNGIEDNPATFSHIPVKYFSTDGGNSWARLQLPEYSPFTTCIEARSGGTAYATGYWGCLVKTTDYGSSWTSLHNWSAPPFAWGSGIYGIDFPTAQTGYAIVDEGEAWIGNILKTTDGGATWFLLDSSFSHFSQNEFRAVDFINENMGCIGGSHIYSTFDGGQTWKLRMSGLGWPGVRSISHTKNGMYMGVGDNGLMVRSMDYGQSWTYITGVPDLDFCSVCFGDATTGYAAGNSTLLKTTDAGITWNPITDGFFIYALDFLSAEEGFGVGYNGLIIHTTDGGQTWEEVNFPTSDDLLAVDFYDSDTGFAVGGTLDISGLILKTTDGGASWHEQFVPVNHPLYGVAVTGNCAFTGGTYCYLFGTTNGGIPVSTVPRENPSPFTTIFPNPSANRITISADRESPGEKTITIYTVTGTSVMCVRAKNQNKVELDVSSLTPGTYFVTIMSSDGIETKKLVIP